MHWLKKDERIHYKIISLTYDFLQTSQPQYIRKLINIKPAGCTRSSNHLTLLRPSTTSLKMSNRSYNRTAPILWSNLSKYMRIFSNTSPNSATTNQCSSLPLSLSKTQFRSHLKTYLFGISYPPQPSFLLGLTISISTLATIKPCIAGRGIYPVTSVSCFYGRHINFNFTFYFYFIQKFVMGDAKMSIASFSCFPFF